MADPKYSNLPGIVYDQPDFYESEDVPAVETSLNNQDESDSVEQLSTNIKESFSKFQGHWLDPRKADFSGKIASKHHTGYNAWSGPYELQAEGEKETIIQKFNRIKCEMAELEQEIAQTKQVASNTDEPLPTEALLQQVSMLQNQLLSLKVEETSGLPIKALHNQDMVKKNLFSKLEGILNSANKAGSSQDGKAGEQDLVYELQFKPHQVELDVSAQAVNLTTRLERLENVLGNSNEQKLNSIISKMGQKSLVDAVKVLHSKVSLLDTANIDQLEGRLSVLLHKLNMVADKQSNIEDAEKIAKVKEVFECAQKLEPLVAVLPSIINRLISLKKLHEEAANISQTVTQLENTQKCMDVSLNTQCQLLSDIQLGLATNMQTMKTAIEELETKLSTKKK